MTVELTEKVISRDVNRGGKFLRTLGTRPRIRSLISPRGYTEQEHRRLWGLLLVLMGYEPSEPTVEESNENLESLRFIDNADGPLLRALQAVLEDRYPDQYGYITAQSSAKEGIESVGVVQKIVDGYAAVRDGTDPERASTRDEDKKVADLLAVRLVLSPEIETDLRDHLAKAQAIAPKVPVEEPADAQKRYQEAAREFHISLKEWREIARQTITRRDYQISLGLASRRKAKRKDSNAPDDDLDRPMD